MKRSVQTKSPGSIKTPGSGDETTRHPASQNSNRQRIQIEDEKFIILIIGAVLLALILGGAR